MPNSGRGGAGHGEWSGVEWSGVAAAVHKHQARAAPRPEAMGGGGTVTRCALHVPCWSRGTQSAVRSHTLRCGSTRHVTHVWVFATQAHTGPLPSQECLA